MTRNCRVLRNDKGFFCTVRPSSLDKFLPNYVPSVFRQRGLIRIRMFSFPCYKYSIALGLDLNKPSEVRLKTFDPIQ